MTELAFMLPMAPSVIASEHFALFRERNWKLKLLAFGLVGTSLVLQLLRVPFIIPLIIQVLVCISMVIY
jgi:hypothetical protein